ncbi:hypothetical protein THEYE_A2022 [Thermodesulfovibrio yellowstonii DSM 11347]|uniref:Uncharacterized protein n=1 Tax=Thermodesulfovibrio yellowstonii (strain ATCC 51303 / DSM 11347 / YP87) TaxID=289376 RepID=B5YIT5_THEYD|nr:hypothetical protein THEYE_A2022 [Thermodesulfovibrio yellowstonii DSM 11347]
MFYRTLKNTTELYIPHGSDETTCQFSHWLEYLLLYIPHGSDETDVLMSEKEFSEKTLYPTWFR